MHVQIMCSTADECVELCGFQRDVDMNCLLGLAPLVTFKEFRCVPYDELCNTFTSVNTSIPSQDVLNVCMLCISVRECVRYTF